MTDIVLSDVLMRQKRGDVTNLPDVAPDGQLLVAKKDNKRLLYVGTGDDVTKISSSADAAGNPLVNSIISGNVDDNDEPDFLTLYGIWQDFVQPTLSANGTLGNSSFAVGSTGENPSHPIYNMFDKQTSTFGQLLSTPGSVIVYNPNPLKVSNLAITNVTGNDNFLNMKIYAGDLDPSAIIPVEGKDLKISFRNNDASDDYGVNSIDVIGTPSFVDQKYHSGANTYLTATNVTTFNSSAWCIQGVFNFLNMTNIQSLFDKYTTASYGLALRRTSTGVLNLWLGSAATTWGIASAVAGTHVLADETDYYVRLRFTGTQYLVDISTNGTTWTNDITITSSTAIYNTTTPVSFGYSVGGAAYYLSGTMDNIMVTVGSSTIVDKETLDLLTLLPSDYVLIDEYLNENHEASETWNIPLTLTRGYKYFILQALDYYDTYEPAGREIEITAQEYVKFGQILALKAGTHEIATYDSGTGKYSFDTVTYPEFYGIDLNYDEILIEDALTKDVSDYAQGVYQIFINGGELDLKRNYFIQPEQPTVKQAALGMFAQYGTPTIADDGIYTGAANSYLSSYYTPRFNQLSTWEIGFKYTHATAAHNQVLICGGAHGDNTTDFQGLAMFVTTSTNLVQFNLSSTGTSWDLGQSLNSTVALVAGTTYWLKFKFTGTAYIFSVSTDDISYIDYTILTSSTKIANTNLRIGNYTNNIALQPVGPIDLKTLYFLTDNKPWLDFMNNVWLDNSIKPYSQYAYDENTAMYSAYSGLHIAGINLLYYALGETLYSVVDNIHSNDFNKNYLDPIIDKLYEPGVLPVDTILYTLGNRTTTATIDSSFALYHKLNMPIGPLIQSRFILQSLTTNPVITTNFDSITWLCGEMPVFNDTSAIYNLMIETFDGGRNILASSYRAAINFTTYTSFSINSGKVDSDGKPDLLDITDTSKVVFNVSAENTIKGTLADGTLINRTSIDDLSVTALDDGIYNLFVGESGACVPLANTIFRQRKEPTYTPNYTIIGTPTISSDYVVSGFSTSNYLTIPVTASDLNEASSFSIISKFRVTSLSSIQYIFSNVSSALYCIECQVSTNGNIRFGYSFNGTTPDTLISTTTISINTDYYVKVEFTGTAYNLYIGTDKNNLTLDKTTSSTSKLYNNGQLIHLGIRGSEPPDPLSGSLYLKECEVNINGLTYWTIVNPIIEDDIWLDTSVKPFASKKYNGTTWEDFSYIPLPQTVTVATGAITAKTLVSGYNINQWDEQIMLPDYNYPTTLTNGALFTAPIDGWVKNSTGMFVLYRGSSYIPASTGFSFYPMKGVV